MNRRRRCGV